MTALLFLISYCSPFEVQDHAVGISPKSPGGANVRERRWGEGKRGREGRRGEGERGEEGRRSERGRGGKS